MEETMTLSQVADMIIVISFVMIGFSFILYTIGELVSDLVIFIKKKRDARKAKKVENKESEPEQ
jgi:hypothetical protein